MKEPVRSPDRSPDWFVLEPQVVRTECTFALDSVRIACTRFDGARSSAAPVLFVHGGGANASWWHPLISLLAPDRVTATIDLSGHGASGRRTHYSHEQWAREVAAAAEILFPGGCVLAGHSMGGAVVCYVAAHQLYRAAAVVSLDGNPAGPPAGRRRPPAQAAGRDRTYRDRGEVLAAIAGRKPRWPEWVTRYVADHSATSTTGGWQISRDPVTMSVPVVPIRLQDLGPIPTIFISGGQSQFHNRDRALIENSRQHGATHVRFYVLPDAGHDLMTEEPLGCAELLRTIG